MSYLKFDKTLLTNLEESLPIEYLRTNKYGAYSSTTVTGCNSRKYHGLLVTPVPELDNENHVLLSSLDETVIQHGAEFHLGIHKYDGDNFAPRGHKYIREFNCETISTTTYRVGGVILTRESFLVLNEPRVLLRYTLVDAHSETTLKLRPQLAFRSVNELTQKNNNVNYNFEMIENGISTCMYRGYPTLYMQLSKETEYHSCPDWNIGVEYPREQVRGYGYKEDLFMPGYFEVQIKKGESIIFSAGLTPAKPSGLKALFTRELKLRHHRDSFFNCLRISATSNILTRNGKEYIIAGWPWFKVRARDTFIALPGSTLIIGDEPEFEKIMAPAIEALRNYMQTGKKDDIIQQINDPDIPLWALWTVQQFAKYVSVEKAQQLYGSFVQEVIDFIVDDKDPDLDLRENGLVYCSAGDEKAISWMNATDFGRPITPRNGYLVEFNALWYNGLRFAIELLEASNGDGQRIAMLKDWAAKYEDNFKDIFVAPGGYLYDYVTDMYADASVRPNQLFALGLPYTPLNKAERKAALDMVTKELLTPKGIRSLTPKAGLYRPYYVGNSTERNYAYHNGACWPWLLGIYTEAYLSIFTRSGVAFINRRLMSYEEEMGRHCIGTLSEVFDGNPPFSGHGAQSLSINNAEVLRALRVVADFAEKSELNRNKKA
ncbi:MAG: glycogen debranching enzyme N-terminal domain-containing protein [Bacteroidales bacterium]|nr:glycogen debranching enzyme N-terminal domain-containing protein [Bacteroidales bacterium]